MMWRQNHFACEHSEFYFGFECLTALGMRNKFGEENAMRITFLQQARFRPAFSVMLFAFSFASLHGCKDKAIEPEPVKEIITDVTGTIKWKVDVDSSLYVVVPDFNPDTAFALTGAFLPSDNLPDEYKGEGVRIYFCGEIINVPSNIQLPAPPIKLTCLIATYTVIRGARGTIQEQTIGPFSYYSVIADFNPVAPFGLTGFPEYLPSDNLPKEFEQNNLRVIFSGEIVQLPPDVDLRARPLILTRIRRL